MSSSSKFPKSLHVLIIAGGSGTRFWPKSRQKKPKQLLSLWDHKTLIEHTVERFHSIIPEENLWIITTESLVNPSKSVLSKYPKINWLAEPMAKNTAPCIYWGIQEILKKDSEALVAVMPADHYIGDLEAFYESLYKACEQASSSQEAGIVMLGIKPNRPETGYGYIEYLRSTTETNSIFKVQQFVEKPNLEKASQYLESGRFLWNAGMFIFKAQIGAKAFQTTMPGLVQKFDQTDSIQLVYGSFSSKEAVSIDYGVLELAASYKIPVFVVPSDCAWNDVGSYPALEELNSCDQMQNTVKGEVISYDSDKNIVFSDSGIVALLGVDDLIVVRDGSVVMVASKKRAQDIKLLLDQVKQKHPECV